MLESHCPRRFPRLVRPALASLIAVVVVAISIVLVGLVAV